MSVLFAGGVASLYVAAVVGVHRFNVSRRRAASGGFPTLSWLDWDELLKGLLPDDVQTVPSAAASLPAHLPPPLGGGPPPQRFIEAFAQRPEDPRVQACAALLAGAKAEVLEGQFSESGLSGGQLRWLKTLSYARYEPEHAIERLENSALDSAQELYLREYLRLTHHVHAFNLELAVFSAKRRLAVGLARYGEVPALFFVRALASARLGMNHTAIDDIARAVYFSRQSGFYLRSVLESPYLEEARPPLVYQCRQALDPSPPLG